MVPTAITAVFGQNFLAKFGSTISEPIFVDNFINSKPQLKWKLTQADAQTEDSLFDVESMNLYRNDIQTRQTAIHMLMACNLIESIENESVSKLTEKVNKDMDYITDFVIRKGNDGYIGWCKEEFVFTSILEGILNMKFMIKLTKDSELNKRLEYMWKLFDELQAHNMVRHTSDFFIYT